MREEFMNFLFSLLAVVTAAACSTTPTGRAQLNFESDEKMASLGQQSFDVMKKEKPISHEKAENSLLKCVTDRLLAVMGENPSEWEVLVFKDDTANAFALPGKKVGVHTGMLKLVQNQSQLAAVVGHEIGHVLAKHGAERMSQALVAQIGMQAANMALGEDSQTNQLILGALGVGAQFGILLPYGRKQESESDELGVRYMARAGFDPAQAVELWKLMGQSGGKGPPEFLSTHPSNATRIKEISELMPEYRPVYEAVSDKPRCG